MPIEQEMSLEELVARLPEHHVARKEYQARCDAFQELMDLCEKWKKQGNTFASRMYGNDFHACSKEVGEILGRNGVRKDYSKKEGR